MAPLLVLVGYVFFVVLAGLMLIILFSKFIQFGFATCATRWTIDGHTVHAPWGRRVVCGGTF